MTPVRYGVLYYVHNDHLGRPELVTNSSKSVVWSSQNNAFGNTPGTDLIGNLDIGFPGQYYDIESGTYYNYFRTYDSSIGRYLQSDPIRLAGGLNPYEYANGNPISNVDPIGLTAVAVGGTFKLGEAGVQLCKNPVGCAVAGGAVIGESVGIGIYSVCDVIITDVFDEPPTGRKHTEIRFLEG